MEKLEKAISWFKAREGRVSYSMERRNGPDSYDCSSSVYHALKEAGVFPQSYWIGNTDTLFGHLEKNGWVQVPVDANGNADTRRGDIFIWGQRGNSGGAAGHTGIFVNNSQIINCRWQAGIATDDHDWLWNATGRPEYTFYRYNGKNEAGGISTEDHVAFPEIYQAGDVQVYEDILQIRENSLTDDFHWEDNGIPESGVTKVDADGYYAEGRVGVGDRFRLVGPYKVLDTINVGNTPYIQVDISGYGIWVLARKLVKIPVGSKGTPAPELRPQVDIKPVAPEVVPGPTKPDVKVDEEGQVGPVPLAPQPREDQLIKVKQQVDDLEKQVGLITKLLQGIAALFAGLFGKK